MIIVKNYLYKYSNSADNIIAAIEAKNLSIDVVMGSPGEGEIKISKARKGFHMNWRGKYTYLSFNGSKINYSTVDFLKRSWTRTTAVTELYLVDDVKDVPTPYYVRDNPHHILRHYIVVPELEQFVNDVYSYLIFVLAGENRKCTTFTSWTPPVEVKGELAKQWLESISKMTNLDAWYALD
ncbi:MAG: hypothetical protein QXO86_07445 [Nitrososphaerota archaeon]